MLSDSIHILNGDSLKDQFPEEITGEQIIARECLVDGDVSGSTLDKLFYNRAIFLSRNYGGTLEDYERKSKHEFLKIADIDHHIEVNLWFEDDLFCQVNFWFVAYLLEHFGKSNPVFLVRPKVHSQYGFAGYSKEELIQLYKDRTELGDISEIGALWSSYQSKDLEALKTQSHALKERFHFIVEAVKAHLERLPSEESPGRPKKVLLSIMDELNTTEFGPVFQEFNKRESIYGFGDLQVKRLFDEIVQAKP